MQSLWMLFASFVFAVMGVCVKLASDMYSTSEMVMYRSIIGMLFIAALVKIQGGTLKTHLPWHHLRRGLIGVTSLWLWFYSISALALPTAMTLNYMSSIWMAAILFFAGWRRGDKRFEWGLVAAILASFVGVTLLLQPALKSDQWFGCLVALGSGMLSALAYLQVRDLGLRGEPEYRVVFYFSATGAIGSVLIALLHQTTSTAPTWHAHTAKGLALLLAIGLCATTAQIAMTRAYRLGNTLVTANLQYTGIVFSAMWSMLIWSDALSAMAWSGIAVILASGVATTFYHTRRTAPDHSRPAVTVPETDPVAVEI